LWQTGIAGGVVEPHAMALAAHKANTADTLSATFSGNTTTS
jgi:hypothetical protein